MTLLQMGIERKVNDIDTLYLRSYSNCTDYDKIFKQSVMLRGRQYYEYLLQGLVTGNNINIIYGAEKKDSEKEVTFEGALNLLVRVNSFNCWKLLRA